jgi:hypothetical protein
MMDQMRASDAEAAATIEAQHNVANATTTTLTSQLQAMMQQMESSGQVETPVPQAPPTSKLRQQRQPQPDGAVDVATAADH